MSDMAIKGFVILKIPLYPPLPKGDLYYSPLRKRGAGGDFADFK